MVRSAARRFEVTLELMEWGLASVRLRIARENPRATKKQCDAMMQTWLDERTNELRPGERMRSVTRTKSDKGSGRRSDN